MVILEFINSYPGFYIIALIITGIFALIRISRKNARRASKLEADTARLFFDITALLSIISLVYFIATNGEGFLFGTEARDLFPSICVTIIFLGIFSIKSLKDYIKNS